MTASRTVNIDACVLTYLVYRAIYMYSLLPTNIAGVFVSEAVEVVNDVDFIEAMFLLRLTQSL